MRRVLGFAVITAVLVAGFGLGSQASSLEWTEVNQEVTWTGGAIDNVFPSDLRDYRPVPLFDEVNDGGRYGSLFYLGGQDAFYGQGSWARTLPSFDNSGDIERSQDTTICDWNTPNLLDSVLGSNCYLGLLPGQSIEISANLPVCSEVVGVNQPCVIDVKQDNQSLNFNRYVDSNIGAYYSQKIRDIEGLDAPSDPNKSRYMSNFVQNPTWDAEPAIGLPAGSSASLWSTDANPLAPGPDQGVYVRATIKAYMQEDGSISYGGLDTQIVKYSMISQDITDRDQTMSGYFYPPAVVEIIQETVDGPEKSAFPFFSSSPMLSFNGPGESKFGTCAFEELYEEGFDLETRCGVALAFDPEDRFEISMRIPSEIGGWFHGRLADANMTLSPTNQSFGSRPLSELTVSGSGVDVPTTSVQFEVCDDPTSFNEYFTGEDCTQAPGLVGQSIWSANSPSAVQDFLAFEELMRDPASENKTKAKGRVNMWSFGTMPSYQEYLDSEGQPCVSFDGGLQGMIATNSMVYQAGIPVLEDGSLDYQIASTELDVFGIPARGDYTLVMRSDLASCIYGLDESFINEANTDITIVGDDGQTRSGTTDLQISQGWLAFKASDFGFSAPTISIAIKKPTSSPIFVPRTRNKPVPEIAPKLNSVPKAGSSVSVSEGSWQSETNAVYSYQWYRCTEGFAATSKLSTKAGCKQITGATSSSYTPTRKDSKFLLSAKVTATNSGGSSSVYTAAAPFGVKKLLSLVTAPVVSGLPEAGNSIRAKVGTWNMKKVKASVLWFSCSSATEASELGKPGNCASTGETGKAFKLKKGNVGDNLVARVTVTKGKQVFTYFTRSIKVFAKGEFVTQ